MALAPPFKKVLLIIFGIPEAKRRIFLWKKEIIKEFFFSEKNGSNH